MDIFRSISDTVANLFSSHKAVDPVHKNDVLDLIDNNLILLREMVSTFDQVSLLKYIRTELLPNNGSNKANTALQQVYTTYLAKLTGVAKHQEQSGKLQSLSAAVRIVLADHEAMRAQFDNLFKDGTDPSEIALEQMKLSHAVIFGYINLSSLLADWFFFFIGQLESQRGEVMRTPAYRMNVVRESGPTVAAFVVDVLQRGPTRGIFSLVQTVKSAGDVAIYTDAATLDSYANINDYPGIRQFLNPFVVFQPILLLREFLSGFARRAHRRNITMREWVQAKLVILQMDAQNMDPQSPEYLRQQQLVQNYSNELSKLDAEIARYEQG
jgi:hypothetical protein